MYLTFKKCVSLQTSKENNYLLSNCMPRINLQAINHVGKIWHLNVVLNGCRFECDIPLDEQQLLTLPKYRNSLPVFSGVRVALSLVFCVVCCRWLFVLLSFFFFAIVLYVLRYTGSDWISYYRNIVFQVIYFPHLGSETNIKTKFIKISK